MSRFEDFDATAPIPDDIPFTMSAAAPTCCQPGRAVDVWGEYDNETAQGGERRHTFRRRAGSAGRTTGKTPTTHTKDGERDLYSGFLMIDCAFCGVRHAFNAKIPISRYRCQECGNMTPLGKMEHLRVICECGARYSYTTNIEEDKPFDVECFNCGAPVAVEWSGRRGRYEPVNYGEWRRGSRGKRKKGGRK